MADRKTLDQVMEQTNKQCGPGTMFTGLGLKKDPDRLPSGVFAIDFATGGGFPIWGTSCLWGPESGGKTSLAINGLAMTHLICWKCFKVLEYCTCSSSPLHMRSVWADVEGTFDREWAHCIGADPEKYIVILADYGEQYVNIADNVLQADDCGLLVVDSLAALTPAAEMEASAEDQFYALQARMIGRMVRRLKQRLIRERKNDHPCTIIFTNQLRIKIGQKFGDPETMSGGMGMKHEFSLLLRCVKKALKKEGVDKKYVGERKQIGVRHSCAIRKDKVLTLAGVGEFVRAKEDLPDSDILKGQVDDFNTVLNYAKQLGVVKKSGNMWQYFERRAKKLESIKKLWAQRPLEYLRAEMEIVRIAKDRVRKEDYQSDAD